MKLKIKRWGINGEGIGYKNRKAIFVENAIPEELVDVQITDDKKTYALAKVNEVMEPSPRRRHPICPLWKECGGCSLMHVDYKGQVRMKESSLREALKKYAGYTGPIEPLMKNPDPLGYRNAFKLPVRKVKGIISTGMFAKNTNDFVKVNRCLIHSKKLETVRSEINELMNKHSLPVANEDGYGLLNIVAKEFDGQVHVVFITTDMELPEAFVDDVMSLENTASVWQSIKSEADPEFELFGKQVMHIAGEMNMSLHLKDYQINLLPRSFFQLNTKQALAVYETVADMIPKHSSLMVEAYSGVGGISLFCADKADQVIGIESIEDAVANANENALMNGKENVKFECGDAAKVLSRISRSNRIDTLVVDPPRAGLNQEMRHAILKAAPETLIYVSCNPSTLAKDIHDLQGMYKIEKVQPIDMFSQTPHVETVCLLSKLQAKQHIEIDLNMDELDLTSAEKKATYQEIKDYVLEHTGLKVSSLYIAQVKQKCGIIERENYNKPKSEDAKQPQCPPDKEKAIKEALKHFGMI